MKKVCYLLLCIFTFINHSIFSQTNREKSILATALIETSPPSIEISWPQERPGFDVCIIKNKLGGAVLPAGTTGFIDSDVVMGEVYEYDIFIGGTTAGYIKVSMEAEADDIKGRLLLVIDDTFQNSLAPEITRLETDIECEGWVVDRLYVDRDMSPQEVKNRITLAHIQYPISTLLLLGHIPIPLSGVYAPDGNADHEGAWPADTYYGDLDGPWFDSYLSSTTATRPENLNVPGDGRFDNRFIPSDVELEVGRIDLHDMPSFGMEEDLLRNYLNKNHLFRTKQITSIERGLIDDNIPDFDIAPWAWRSFSVMFGDDDIDSNTGIGVDYFTDMQTNSYLWSFGAGGGSYTSCAGVITSEQWATNIINTIFTSMCGPYFGDFNSTDNLLRAPLASDSPTLVNFWGGIPSWALQDFVGGKHIGYSAKLSQNNISFDPCTISGVYGNFNNSQRAVHIALMGDPTLKMHTLTPPSNLQASISGNEVNLNWDAAAHTDVLGYHVYRMDPLARITERLTTNYITATTFSETTPNSEKSSELIYIVRAVELKSTPSGRYFNLSSGICDTIPSGIGATPPDLSLLACQLDLSPNCGEQVSNTTYFTYCGAENLQNFTIEYTIAGSPMQTQMWAGNLENGDIGEFELENFIPEPGNRELTIILSEPNGIADANVTDNQVVKTFEIIQGYELNLDFETDDFGHETYIQVFTESDDLNPVASLAGFESNENYNRSLCLAEGCYNIKINDSNGNGICCSNGEGSYSISYNGELVASGGEFLDKDSIYVCIPIECAGFNNETVSISSDGAPGYDISEIPDSTCTAIELTLTASGGTDYLWENGETGPSTIITMEPFQTSYMVTVTNDEGCALVDTALFLVFNQPPLSAGEDIVTCPGGNATLIASAGNGTFYWETIEEEGPVVIVNPLVTTEYVVVYDQVPDCQFRDTVVVFVEDFEVEVNVIDNLCPSEDNGGASLNIINGQGPYGISWSSGTQAETISNMFSGQYSVIVNDLNGCSAEVFFEITEPDAIDINLTGSNETIAGASDGSATVNASGGSGPYTYLWSNGSTNQTINDLSPNLYSVTVTDANMCQEFASITIELGSDPCRNFELSISGNDVSCFGENNGTATASVTGDNGGLSYEWSTGETTSSIQNLSPGTYELTVSDSSDCTSIENVVIESPEELIVATASTDPICFGSNDGNIDIDIFDGTSPYQVEWNNGSTTESLTSLSGGDYSYTVIDANSCIATGVVTIIEPLEIQIEFESTDISCNDSSDGSLQSIISDAFGNVLYSWSTGSQTSDIDGLNPGLYSLTVTDGNGCEQSNSIEITEPQALELDISSTNETSLGAEDGSASVSVSGGSSPYNYIWSNAQTNSSIQNIGPGTYIVTVSDANDCTATASTTVLSGSDPCLDFSLEINTSPVTCFGDQDGIAIAIVENGFGNIIYEWSNGAEGSSFDAFSGGNYSLTVNDQNECELVQTFTIEEPEELNLELIAQDILCFGDANGSIQTNVDGGNMPYIYSWSNGSTDEVLDGLAAGTYSLEVTDSKDCFASASVEINMPTQIEFTLQTTNESEENANDGTATIMASGGTGSLLISWINHSNGGTNNLNVSTITDLTGGEYTVVVTDENDCEVRQEFSIFTDGDPCATFVAELVVEQTTCFGLFDASIEVIAEGGTGEISFSWSHSSIEEGNTISNLSPGLYEVTIEDENECAIILEATIVDAPQLIIGASSSNIICDQPGSINLNISTDDYSASWQGGEITEFPIEVFESGVFEISVLSLDGCEETVSLEITDDSYEIELVDFVDIVFCFGEEIDLSIDTDFNIEWSTGDTTVIIEGVGAGMYSYTVTDNFGCTGSDSFTVVESEELIIDIQTTESTGGDNGTATASVNSGNFQGEYEWSTGDTGPSISGLAPGEYELTVTDIYGCEARQTFIIEMGTSTIQIEDLQDFNILPNPATESILVNIEFVNKTNYSLSLVNILGKELWRNQGFATSKSQFIDISSYTAGTYLVSIKTKKGTQTEKLIIVSK